MSSDVIKRQDPTDDYELLQRVGSGTYGEVYKARHIRSGELSAVKVVKLEAGDNFAIIQQEIMMIRDCVHQNIIAYHGSYLRRDRLWIVMEYCGGGSLQDIYHMTGPLSELQIAFVCRETLKGLDYLHKMGKVHRDIKGANILLTNRGDVKLADFGVAAQITATIGKRKSFIGTPYWMAPEVACVERRGGYGVQCDVWAVGITAIEFAECQPPLFDLHPMQVLYLMTKSSYKSPQLKDKHRWSPLFHDFVRQCLTKNPRKRPSPEKLLTSHHFVLGSLSSRMTRDLLDKVNNGSTSLATRYSQRDPNAEEVDDDEEEFRPSNSPTFRVAERMEGRHFRRPVQSPPQPPALQRRAIPMKDLPPLPDLVGGDSLLRGGDGVIHDDEDDGTLKPGMTPPPREPPRRSGLVTDRSSSVDRNKVNMRGGGDEIPTKPRPVTYFGLPITPKVAMGACFSQMIHDCSLNIHASATWVHPLTASEYLLLGCEEGLYGIDISRLHDAQLIRLHHRRCPWLYVHKDVLMTMQGKTSYVFRHDLLALLAKNFTLKISKPMSKVPERFIPKRLAITVRLPETKDCVQCTVEKGAGPHAGQLFLAVAVPSAVLLFQWYDPQNKFLIVRSADLSPSLRVPLNPFRLINTRSADFPQLCVGVRQAQARFQFEYIKFGDLQPRSDPDATLEMVDDGGKVDIAGIEQIDKDCLLVAYKNRVAVCDLNGNLRSWRDGCPKEFILNFFIETLIPLADSFLAFHANGVQGRSLENDEITQELFDVSKIYKVIGNDRLLVLKSHPLSSHVKHGVCFLTGHTDTPGLETI